MTRVTLALALTYDEGVPVVGVAVGELVVWPVDQVPRDAWRYGEIWGDMERYGAMEGALP